jgi:hypothetical protein
MKNMIFILVILGALAAAPNALWLMYSTVRITSESSVLLHDVALRVDNQSIPVGNIFPTPSRFAFLPREFGEATLTIEYEVNDVPKSHCQAYVESTAYHVEVVVNGDDDAHCSVELPTFSSLFVQKLF